MSLFNPSINGDAVREEYQLQGKKVILFVRALDSAHHHSGLEYLLSSVASIDAKDVALMIVGDGNLKEYYIETSKKMGISDKVFFVGRVENKLLPSYYAASDLVVLPSTLTENFPLILLEAMASGKAVVCSNLPELGIL
jgi:glycosyltransferase involved in cell wall biosynthesis